jgi:dynein heavy chain, axonemal
VSFHFLILKHLAKLYVLSLDIMDFCQNIRKPVESLQSRTLVIQANLVEIKKIMSTWAKIPLFERKDARKDMVLCLDERVDRKTKRYAEIEAAAVKIKKYNTLKRMSS